VQRVTFTLVRWRGERRKNKGSVKTTEGGLFFAKVTVKINCSKTMNMPIYYDTLINIHALRLFNLAAVY
jgi:hypothetical protein